MIPFNPGSRPVRQTCLNVTPPERIEPALGSSVRERSRTGPLPEAGLWIAERLQ